MNPKTSHKVLFKATLLLLIFTAVFSGCKDEVVEGNPLQRNILFYVACDNNLDYEAAQKINEIRSGWNPLYGEMIIYVDIRNKGASLLRINETQAANGRYGLDTIAVYGTENSASAEVLNRAIDDMKQNYPADSYGMIFFSHASGWLPQGTLNRPRSLVIDNGEGTNYEIEYDEFASAIPDHCFDFIIFEACLMADVMTMYELRNKADYVLASSAEIVSPGFTPIYKDEAMHLFDTRTPVKEVLAGFAQSYYNHLVSTYPENSAYRSTTMSLIKMDEMEALASTTKALLQGRAMNETTLEVNSIQGFDRPKELISYSYPKKCRYFDFEDVIKTLVPESKYQSFSSQMEKTVIWKVSTNRFLLSDYINADGIAVPNYEDDGFFIHHHSGLTTYIVQEVYPFLNTTFQASSWYNALY